MAIETDNDFTLATPVIVDARTNAGVQPLIDFLESLRQHDNATVAAAEARRLDPYFSAMSAYYNQAITDAPVPGEWKSGLKNLTTKSNLSDLFNAMAERRHNVMLSEVIVMPTNIKETGPAKHIFANSQFDIPYNHLGFEFKFGFCQVLRKQDGKTHSAAVMPTFSIDNRMIDRLPPDTAQELLRAVQDVMTFVNHDIMHHFTMPVINTSIVYDYSGDSARDSEVRKWNRNISGYEEWAHIAHEKVLLQPESAQTLENIGRRVEGFFGKLSALPLKNPPAEAAALEQRRHETVDFFGTMMLHILSRALPLNHPILTDAITRLEKADAGSAKATDDFLKDISDYVNSIEGDEKLSGSRDAFHILTSSNGRVVRNAWAYKGAGLDIEPARYSEMPYKDLKLLELMHICRYNDDIVPHIPSVAHGFFSDQRKDIDIDMMHMIEAAAEDARFSPKKQRTPVIHG